MAREFRHALTGRSFVVLPGSRAERLVEADKQWTEVKPESSKVKQSEPTPGGSRGTGNAGRRRNASRKGADGNGDPEG